MKNLLYSLLLLAAYSQPLMAQKGTQSFDPQKCPIAIELDSNVLMNVVSEYVLVQALDAPLHPNSRIISVRRIDTPNIKWLQYEVQEKGKQSPDTYFQIPLVKGKDNGWYAMPEGAITCTGCEGCKPQEGKPCGCCDAIKDNVIRSKIKLKKIEVNGIQIYKQD